MISYSFIVDQEPGDTLFLAYSNDYSLEVAAVNAAREMESYNEAAATRLLDRYVRDPQLRQRFDTGAELPPPDWTVASRIHSGGSQIELSR